MKTKTRKELFAEIGELRTRLEVAEETLRAIREGEVDALVVSGAEGEQIFTLKGAEQPYRVLIETMNEGAVTLTTDGTILYCNNRFAEMLKTPLQQVIGSSIYRFIALNDQKVIKAMLQEGGERKSEIGLQAEDKTLIPAFLSVTPLEMEGTQAICMVVTDLTEQKRTEEILKAERLSRSILDQATEAIVVCNEKGEITRASQMAHELSAKNLLFRHFDIMFPLELLSGPEGRQEALSFFEIQKERNMTAREVRLTRQDGRTLYLLLSAGPLRNELDEVLATVVTMADITERKQAEQQRERLRVEAENEKRRLEAVMEALPVGVAITDAKGGNIRANNAFEQVWGGPRPVAASVTDYALYKAWWSETGKPVAPEEWASAQAVEKGESVVGQLLEIQRFDGSRASVINSGAPIFDSDGKIAGCAVAIQDITELRRMEESLRRSEEKFRVLADNTYDMEDWINPEGQFVFMSPSCKRITGHDASEHMDNPNLLREIVHPEDLPIFDRHRQEEEEEVTPEETQFRIIYSDGSIRWIGHVCQRIFDEEGRFLGIRGSNRDITERKQAEMLSKALNDINLIINSTLDFDEIMNRVVVEATKAINAETAGVSLYKEDQWEVTYAYGLPEEVIGLKLTNEENPHGLLALKTRRPVAINDCYHDDRVNREIMEKYGIRAVMVAPLFAKEEPIGAIFFNYHKAPLSFTDVQTDFVNKLATSVSMALENARLFGELKKSRDELEIRVQERTAELMSVVGELQDEMSERKRIEETLIEQSKILEGFFTSTITPLVFLDKDFNFIRVNEAYAKACQREISEFPGHNHFEFYPSDAKGIFEQVVETKTPYQAIAKPFTFPDHPEWGTTYWNWNLTPLLDEMGEVEFLVFSLEDVTVRKWAEEAVKTERQRFNDVLEILPVYLVLLTRDYHVPFANRFFRERFGESQGRRCFEYLFDRSGPCEVCESYTVLKNMAPHRWEWTGPDGRNYDVFDFPFTDSDGSTLILEMGIDITERKRAEEALRESENRLRHLSSQLLTVQENERRSIARELHDGVGQILTAVKFKVESTLQEIGEGKGEPKRKPLEDIIPMIKESMDEVRRIQMDLRPSILDDLGILATLEWFCREYQKIYSFVRIEKEIGIQEKEVSTSLKTVVYRVVQEAMNNIAKHSKADLVHLSLGKGEDKIQLVIQDNGQGFDFDEILSPERVERGLGLNSMRERTELSGGAFEIESAPGEGTTIKATWPL